MDEKVTKKKKLMPGLIIGIAAGLVLIAGIVAFLFFFVFGAAGKAKVKKQLDLGEKYLTELDYDKAILAYKEAIAIDPKNVEGYMGLAEAYRVAVNHYEEEYAIKVALDYVEDAITDMKAGVINTNDDQVKAALEEFKDKNKELEEGKESAEDADTEGNTEGEEEEEDDSEEELPEGEYQDVDPASVPVGYMDWISYDYGDYDCTSFDDVVGILTEATWLTGNVYPDALISETKDDWHWSIRSYKEDPVDSVLRDFYHVNDEIINRIKTEALPQYESYVAYENGNYVHYLGNVGGRLEEDSFTITSVQFNGRKYRFEYEHYVKGPWSAKPDDPYLSGTGYAIMEYKTINGQKYWTLYEEKETSVF